MKRGFTPISLERYVELHLQANPGTGRKDLVRRLRQARDAYERGEACHCGAPIWIIGSAEVGLSCFTCITGEAFPDDDYEIVSQPLRRSQRPPSKERQRRIGEAAMKCAGTIEGSPDLAENARAEVRARLARRHGL